MNFSQALNAMKQGLKVSRKVWEANSGICLEKGKTQSLAFLERGIGKFYDLHEEFTRSPKFIMERKDKSIVEVNICIEDMLSEDWFMWHERTVYNEGSREMGDIKLNCMDTDGWKDTEKVRHTLEGVIVDLGKGGDAKDKVGPDETYPDFVCIKDDEVRGAKRGNIFRYDNEIGYKNLHYYHYAGDTKSKIYLPLANLSERYQYYQELRRVNCEVVDEWHVRFKAVEKVPDVKAVPYRVERISEEEIKRTIDVNRNLINDCGEKLGIANDAKWQEFEIRVNGDVKEIKFENGVLVTIRIPKKG